MRADDLRLRGGEIADGSRKEVAPVGCQRIVVSSDRLTGPAAEGRLAQHRHFFECAVCFAPDRRGPAAVEFLDGSVTFAQEVMPDPLGQEGVIAVHVAHEFVVDLPGHEGRVPAVALGHGADDPRHLPPVDRRDVAGVAARTVAEGKAVHVNA
jgi:hypothetical protein